MARDSRRFPVRLSPLFTVFSWAFTRTSPKDVWVEVGARTVTVRYGTLFDCEFNRDQITSARLDSERVRGYGVHQSHGVWLVNGSRRGVVRIDLAQSVRGNLKLAGSTTVGEVKSIRVSVKEPDGLVSSLTAA